MTTLTDLDHLPKHRQDWLGVWGNQWKPAKMRPGTCELCVYGSGQHAAGCAATLSPRTMPFDPDGISDDLTFRAG